MIEIQDRAGAKWFAGIMLAIMVIGMMPGFVQPAYAEEGGDPPVEEPAPAQEPEPEPEPEPELTTQSEETPAEETEQTTAEQNQSGEPEEVPGEEGEDGADGAPIEDETPAQDGEDGAPNEDGESGEQGEEGESQGEEPLPDGEAAEVQTGDANSGTTGATAANITAVDANAASSTASTTPSEGTNGNGGGGGGGGGANGPTAIDIGSEVLGTTTASSTSNTGLNVVKDPDGALFETGDATSFGYDVMLFNIALVKNPNDDASQTSELQIEFLLNPTEEELDFRAKILAFFSFTPLLSGSGGSCIPFYDCGEAEDVDINNSNTAGLDRTMYVGANTGGNSATSSDGFAGGTTGNAHASGVLVNMGNWFAVSSKLMVLLVNQVGDINADIILPEASFFEGMRGGGFAPGTSLVSNNTADITNNAGCDSTSGDNSANGDEFSGVGTDDSRAKCGSYSGVNQINPPTCFIISVGGTWSGDVYQLPQGFDRISTPLYDLICGRGTGESNAQAYSATTTNYAKLVNDLIVEATSGENSATGQAAGIVAGKAETFGFILNLVNQTFSYQDWIFGLFTVSGDWDGDLTFGARPGASPAEQVAGEIVSTTSSEKKKKKSTPLAANVELTKTVSVEKTSAPSVVDYTITLVNNGPKIYTATLEDVLSNPAGNAMNTQEWYLGTVDRGEEIVVKYSVEFKGDLLPGEYINAVRLTGKLTQTGPMMKPIYTSSSLQVEGEVLGIGACPAYLTGYVTTWGKNDPEQVRLLEVFLRDGRGEPVSPDGVYDYLSVEAVKRFQAENVNDILAPWGIDYPTGQVYFTTRKKINELYCNGEKDFPLSPLQVHQIEFYRNGTLQEGPTGVVPMYQWSAIDFPLLAEMNFFEPVAMGDSAESTPELFGLNAFTSHPLLTLLRDIFSQFASGFGVETAKAAVYTN